MTAQPDSSPLALITGGGSGIGAATAMRLAARGFEVAVAGRRQELLDETVAAVRAAGGQARAVVLDVTDAAAVARVVPALERLDVLVNNAGGAIGLESVADADLADWQAMYDTNVLGTVRVTQAALPLLERSPYATIVVMGSVAGEVAYEGGAGYCAAKFGEHALAQTLRLELAGRHIRVVEIMPGMVHTEGFSLVRFRGDQAKADGVYAGVDRPMVADDVAACVEFVVLLPQHVNVERLVVRPVAQAAQHKVHRGPIDWHDGTGAS